jgi:putative membrane protein
MAAGALDGVAANINTRMLPGIDRMKAGLHNPGALADCAAASETATPADDCGIRDAVAYFRATAIPTLVSQLTNSIASELLANIAVPAGGCDPHKPTLLCGAGALADGGGELAGGSSELAAGLGRLDAGAGKLAGGAGDAADGSGRLAAGADQLSSGLEDAADGSGRLADGLTKAAGGGPKLVHGAQRLSDEGTKQLVKAGEDTAQSYGELYATMAAGAQRARSEGMAFGAPKGAVGLTAYNYVITGDDGENGRNWTRGVGAWRSWAPARGRSRSAAGWSETGGARRGVDQVGAPPVCSRVLDVSTGRLPGSG